MFCKNNEENMTINTLIFHICNDDLQSISNSILLPQETFQYLHLHSLISRIVTCLFEYTSYGPSIDEDIYHKTHFLNIGDLTTANR